MKWYKFIKLLVEILSFGLLTYEKVKDEEKTDEEDSNRSATDSTANH